MEQICFTTKKWSELIVLYHLNVNNASI